MDLPQWMANELRLADRVVIVAGRRYKEQADRRMGGVGWETMLIQGEMMSGELQSDHRYIVVVREDDFELGADLPEGPNTAFTGLRVQNPGVCVTSCCGS